MKKLEYFLFSNSVKLKLTNAGPFDMARGLKKNPKSIKVGSTFILESRTCVLYIIP